MGNEFGVNLSPASAKMALIEGRKNQVNYFYCLFFGLENITK